MSRRSVVIHGHFYQPPREDPWTGRVPLQMSAAPHHDWNARVHDECYRTVVAARLLDDRGRIVHVVNTLAWMSWDAGPTLLEWMAREEPETYRAFLEADRLARDRCGHGGALATPYHHVILPLASRREKQTEVRWGMADFRRRFGREPEGMWLPEAAVDRETLEVLAQEGIRFTVLGPGQVRERPAAGRPGRVALAKGRSIAVFVYDGPLSHDVAFGAVLQDSSRWVDRLVHAPAHELVAVATDGETFGHHHKWAEMALAATLAAVDRHPALRIDNFASFLERHPAVDAVEVVEPSSWSCVHGVERWRSACGCRIEPGRPTQQEWRTALRSGLEELAAALHGVFKHEGATLFADSWAALDAFGGVQGAGDDVIAAFIAGQAGRALDVRERARARQLLEMERDVLRMRTSCAWFFDDVARLEPLQNLLYAAHALDLAGGAAAGLEDALLRHLERAVSNDPAEGTAARMWRTQVTPLRGTRAAEVPSRAADDAAVTVAIRRAVEESSTQAVDVALAALAAAPHGDRFDAQTVVARDVARRGTAVGPTARLAESLGVAPEVTGHGLPADGPVRFVFGVHVHQPVGNFDEVFQSHVESVYLPFLERCAERRFLPLVLHVSGPLLEWLEGRGHRYLDEVARMVADGSIEPLLAGFYEPVLPALSREDRIEQIGWMREWIRARLGVDARGLWLTERVWEPGLARDLADAGVGHVLLDDRHFLVAGLERRALDRPWRTEADGRSLAVLPIDERLRYLIPFRSPSEIGAHFRRLAAGGHAMAVLADDGEKFGGWPGTAEWVWGKGWLTAFLDEMERLSEGGVVRLATAAEVVREVPAAGLAYLPTASYREMELWSLPPLAASTLERAGELLASEPEAAGSLRGGHWRGFLAKYDESNRMHKKAQVLSELCRKAGDPPSARRAIGRAQCNDPYWHGVFGGLYLKHLRDAVWQNLAEAECILRERESLEVERLDLDGDGLEEIWVHAPAFSAVVRPERGGTLVELTNLRTGVNLGNVLTRRRESYHRVSAAASPTPHGADEGAMPSIHEIEEGLRVDELPPVDLDVRAMFVDRVLPTGVDLDRYARAEYAPLHTWSRDRFHAEVAIGERAAVRLRSTGLVGLEKTLAFSERGDVEVTYVWDPAALPGDAWFAPELSLAVDPGVRFAPEPASVWRYDIVTMSKRESGLEETVQGAAVTPLWPTSLGRARVLIPAGTPP